MPLADQQRLIALVHKGQDSRLRVRFWNAPDNPSAWQELVEAGAEINTDKPIPFHHWYEQWNGSLH